MNNGSIATILNVTGVNRGNIMCSGECNGCARSIVIHCEGTGNAEAAVSLDNSWQCIWTQSDIIQAVGSKIETQAEQGQYEQEGEDQTISPYYPDQ